MPTPTATPCTRQDRTAARVRPRRAVAPVPHPSPNRPRALGWARGSAGRREAGQAAIQTAILFSVVLALIIGCIQGMLWFAGRQVAIAAASEGARVASAEGGTTQSGQAAAVEFANTTGRGFLLFPRATVTLTDTTATVTLTGSTQSLVGGGDWTITQSASMPVERLTAPTGTRTP
ncbi:Flp pilus assembly protein TadG [Promicromonospora sp. AC04]|uniref:TadE/TadG family type IV pilus assembly protein n=1 Tax=Promicromonospora sp. AC04 TaxID=2135723 RepID=UPI000D3B0B60|nr:TadE family protein [Promicromonospora sp. AC04]PUB20855.1 Flp pilus assembly protein TadG [Promicromonospora sp. AC04]